MTDEPGAPTEGPPPEVDAGEPPARPVTSGEEAQRRKEEDASAGRRMTLATIVVTAFLMVSKVAGLVKEMVLARFFGAGAATDAFKVIYNGFVMVVYTKIEKLERPCFLPLFVKRKETDGDEAAWELAGVVMVLHLLVLIVIAALAFIFAPVIVGTFWPSIQGEGFRLAVLFMRIMAPALVAFSLSVVPELTLHSYKQFTIPALADACFRIVVLVALVALVLVVWKPDHPNAILSIGIGVALGGAARLFVQLPAFVKRWRVPSMAGAFAHIGAEVRALAWYTLRSGYKPVLWLTALTMSVAVVIGLAKTDWPFLQRWVIYGLSGCAVGTGLYLLSVMFTGKNAAIKAATERVDAVRNRDAPRLWGLIPPIIVGLTYSSVRQVIDTYCGTEIGEGVYTCLDYARRLPDTMAQILPMAVSFVVYPFLSEWAHRGEKDRLGEALVQTTRIIAFVFIPAAVWMIALRWGVLWFVYSGGEFTPDKQSLTILALLAYAPGMAFFSIEGILNKWYFALDDTRTPNYVGAACAMLHVVIALVGVFKLGLGDYAIVAVALALTISKSTKVVILYALLRGRVGKVEWRPIISFAARLAVACAVMGVVLYFVAGALEGFMALDGRKSALVHLAAASAIGIPVFLVVAVVLRIEETSMVINHLKKRVLRKAS